MSARALARADMLDALGKTCWYRELGTQTFGQGTGGYRTKRATLAYR